MPGGQRRSLFAALVLLAVGGFLLHFRIHPFLWHDPAHPGSPAVFRGSFVPATLLPFLDIVVVTLLFSARRTAALGYLLNGLIVIFGTVLMGDYSIAMLLPKHPQPLDWVLKSTLPDIATAWADFFVGQALFDSWMRES